MSRIAKYPVAVPQGVEATIAEDQITVKGPRGTLTQPLDGEIKIELNDGELSFITTSDSRHAKAMSGTVRSLVKNMVTGVSTGFTRKLLLIGVGFRAQVQGDVIKLQLGYSHDIEHKLPEGVTAKCPTPTEIELEGADKQVIGQCAAEIRAYRRPEPYKGKGVRYAEEQVALKEAKKK